jgi:hypothetical protein
VLRQVVWADATVEVALDVKVTAKGGIKFAVLGIGADGGAEPATGRIVRAQVRCVPAGMGQVVVGRDIDVRGQVVGGKFT